MSKAAHRIEECFKRAKSEAGLGDCQVRNWIARHHHQGLSLLAAWFLNQETQRGKNRTAALTPPGEGTDGRSDRGTLEGQRSGRELSSQHAMVVADREGTAGFPSLA